MERFPGEGFCLVLSGGGAKGVYHIGVWRALKELGIRVDCFVGASIGAIMAGFLAQGSDDALERLAQEIDPGSLFALPAELLENGEVKLDLDSLSAAREFFLRTIDRKGLDTSPMKALLASSLDEARIRSGGKDLGIVTVNLSELKPREVFIDEMEEGLLHDYLLASAAFPGLERPVIKGDKYADGGMHDNIPYAMARKRGYRNIIVSDITGIGRNRRPHIDGTCTVYIKNSIDMGGIFDFDRKFREDFTRLGYLDTMRTFGRLVGYSYFVRPDHEAEAMFTLRFREETSREKALPPAHPAAPGANQAADGVVSISGTLPGAAGKAAETPAPAGIDTALAAADPPSPDRMRHDRRRLLVSLECAATILGVERIREYTYAELAAAISARRAEVESGIERIRGADGGGIGHLAPSIRTAIASRRFIECPYYYYRLVAEIFPKRTAILLVRALVALHAELPAGVAWLEGRSSLISPL